MCGVNLFVLLHVKECGCCAVDLIVLLHITYYRVWMCGVDLIVLLHITECGCVEYVLNRKPRPILIIIFIIINKKYTS